MSSAREVSGRVTIYGLCDAEGTVQYVGQTRRVSERRRAHAKRWPELSMIVLSTSDEEHADAVEREWIARYSQAGQLRNILGTEKDGHQRSQRARRARKRRTANDSAVAKEQVVVVHMRLPGALAAALKAVARHQCRTPQQQVVWCVRHAPEVLADRAAANLAAPEQEQL
jgi:hypothetical protein